MQMEKLKKKQFLIFGMNTWPEYCDKYHSKIIYQISSDYLRLQVKHIY